MNVVIPLAGGAAVAAAALFTYNTVTAKSLLEEQHKQLRETAISISSTYRHPPTVLVLGFENHGRSSFVNTVIRVLHRENGPLVMRAETGPCKRTTTATRVFSVKNKALIYPKYLLNLIDTPTFSAARGVDEKVLRSILRGENGVSPKERSVPAADCVVLVIRSEDCCSHGPAWKRLPDLIRVMREEGLQLVVVLTDREQVKKAKVNLQELTRNIAVRTDTDCVYCIENYIVEHRADGQNSAVVKNNFDTDIQTLSIVRQCFEYAKYRRRITHKRSRSSSNSKNSTAVDEIQTSYPSSSD